MPHIQQPRIPNVSDFVNQAVGMSQDRKVTVAVDDAGRLSSYRIGSWSKNFGQSKLVFIASNTTAWNNFRNALTARFGGSVMGSDALGFEQLVGKGERLTARHITQVVAKAQKLYTAQLFGNITIGIRREVLVKLKPAQIIAICENLYSRSDFIDKDEAGKITLLENALTDAIAKQDAQAQQSHTASSFFHSLPTGIQVRANANNISSEQVLQMTQAKPGFERMSPEEQHAYLRQAIEGAINQAKHDMVGGADFKGGRAPTGLASRDVFLAQTSVEDRKLTKGATLGLITTGPDVGKHRYIYEGLKTKGAEPGFLVRKNWLPSHNQAMCGQSEQGKSHPLYQVAATFIGQRLLAKLQDTRSSDAFKLDVLRNLKQLYKNNPAINDAINAKFAAIRELRRSNPSASLRSVDLSQLLGDISPERQSKICLNLGAYLLKNGTNLDGILDEARQHIQTTVPEFSTMHVIKLDYNEADAAGESLRLPKRIREARPVYGRLRLTNVEDVNAGAVSEAMANDLSRMFGVPSQDLRIIRGKYSTGELKLLLDSTYVAGKDGMKYRDFDAFIHGGYIDKSLLRAAGHSTDIEGIGRYKASLLLFGDRDAVGKRGQNKGFVGDTFVAIDPGHSFEGAKLSFDDDFSFSYASKKFWMGQQFSNFTIFDDAPLSEKMAGLISIRNTLQDTEAMQSFFTSYRRAFAGDGAYIQQRIDSIQAELTSRYDAMMQVFGPRVALYEQDPRYLDLVDNMEKLFSPTSTTSPDGSVDLDYLRISGERVPLDMQVLASGDLQITARNELGINMHLDTLSRFLSENTSGSVGFNINNNALTIPKEHIESVLAAFTDQNVRAAKVS